MIKKRKLFFLFLFVSAFFSVTVFLCVNKMTDVQAETEYIMPLTEYTIVDYNENYTVTSPLGEKVEIINGKFFASEIGDYVIKENGVTVRILTVFGEYPSSEFNLVEDFPGEFIAGDRISIPKVQINSSNEIVNKYNVDIVKNGVVINSFKDIDNKFNYIFKESGQYKVVYWFKDFVNVIEKKEISILVKDEPIIVFGEQYKPICYSFIEFDTSGSYAYYKDFFDVTLTLKNPNGNIEKILNNVFTPKVCGEYSIIATADINGLLLEKQFDFIVKNSYASYFNSGNNFSAVSDGTETPLGVLKPYTGISLQLNGKDSYIYYNTIIDLRKIDKSDTLLSFYIDSERSNVSQIRATLVDVYDETNTVSVLWKQNQWNNDFCYSVVGYDEYYIGLDNESGSYLPREVFGTLLSNTSFRKNNQVIPFNFSYSLTENAVYTNNGISLLKVLDLDDEVVLQDRRVFKGFTTGEVYLRIELLEPNVATLIIGEIAGKKMDSSIEYASSDVLHLFYDKEFINHNTTLNNGLINTNYNLPRPLFEDIINGNLDVNFTLYSGDEDITNLVNDYSFTPNSVGTYRVVYKCKDIYLNEITKEYEFNVLSNYNPIILKNEDVNYLLGTIIKTPTITYEGGIGKIDVKTVYKYNNRVIQPDINSKIELNEKGKLVVEVTLTDFLGKVVNDSFDIVINSDVVKINIDEEPISFFTGREYVLPDFTAIDYSKEEGEIGYYLSKTIKVDGVVIGNDRKFTFNNVGCSHIEYIGDYCGSKEIIKDLYVSILDGEVNELKDYIISDDAMEMNCFKSGLALEFSDNISFKLPNPLSTQDFSFGFSYIEGLTSFSRVKVTLTDYLDENKKLSIYIYPLANEKVAISLDTIKYNLLVGKNTYDNSELTTSFGYNGKKYYSYQVKLLEQQKIIANSKNEKIVSIKTYNSNDIFEGFNSKLVRMDVEVEGVTGKSALVINNICNQPFTTVAYLNKDTQEPIVGLTNNVKSYVELGEQIEIGKIICYDVLQGKGNIISSYLLLPDGSKVDFDYKEGLKYTVNKYGVYKIIVKAEDYFGNIKSPYFEQNVKCIDTVCPEVILPEIDGTLKTNVKWNVPGFDSIDNVGINSKMVFLRDANNKIIVLQESYEFTAEGEYELIFYSSDFEGNTTSKIMKIVVEKNEGNYQNKGLSPLILVFTGIGVMVIASTATIIFIRKKRLRGNKS